MALHRPSERNPVPNYTRDVKQGIARWGAYLYVPDPDALAAEFSSRNVQFQNHSKIPAIACADSNLRTLTATFCFSVVLVRDGPNQRIPPCRREPRNGTRRAVVPVAALLPEARWYRSEGSASLLPPVPLIVGYPSARLKRPCTSAVCALCAHRLDSDRRRIQDRGHASHPGLQHET